MAMLAGAACMRCASVFFASDSLWGGEGALALWRPAPERIRSKNVRLSAQRFTRRYEMLRDIVTVH